VRVGHKVHPRGFRIGITESWSSRWYASRKEFGQLILEDHKIREHVKKHYRMAGIPRVDIERRGDEVRVYLPTARPGIIIGRKGAKVDILKNDLERLTGKQVEPKILEMDKPELNAQLVAEMVSDQLKKRQAFRRVLRKTVEQTMERGAQGVRIQVAGRLAGADMARREATSQGKIPLQTLQANIEYGFSEAKTTYGVIGVKVWIYKGYYETQQEGSHGSPDAQAGQVSKDSARKG
jgi:small subunit ribosomal protein S3